MMLRSVTFVYALLSAACTIDTVEGMAFDSGGADPDGTSATTDAPGSSGAATTGSGDEPGGTGEGTTGAAGTTGDSTGSGSTGGEDPTGASSGGDLTAAGSTGGDPTAGGSTGGSPGGEPWSECLMGSECGAGMGCLNNGANPTDGFCTQECVGFADPTGCPTAPAGGTALLTCVPLGGQNICALDCAGGKTCPGGMTCVQEQADSGTIDICM